MTGHSLWTRFQLCGNVDVLMIITFIGYRGCGKSTVASLLADRLNRPSVDTDDEIERRAGCSIREIFDRGGEAEFRKLEQTVIAELLARTDLILAAGGGAILASETRKAMRDAGPVVWLSAPIEELSRRIAADETSAARRPSLTGRSATAEIADVLKSREPLYRETASIVIDTTGLSPQAVADAVYEALPPRVLTDQ